MKYNLSIFNGLTIIFDNIPQVPTIKFEVNKSRMTKKEVIFLEKNGNKCEVKLDLFNHFRISRISENTICFTFDETILSGLIAFTMFDTYGFPPELTNETLNYKVDLDGYEVCRQLQKDKNKNNKKDSGAFNN